MLPEIGFWFKVNATKSLNLGKLKSPYGFEEI